MQVTTKLDYQVVPRGEFFTVRLLVRLTPQTREEGARRPLNIGLVLDRSGSMEGEKLRCVKSASRQLISMLSAGDILSITTFDDNAAGLVPAIPIEGGREALISAVDWIEPGGWTDLCAGYELGGASLQRTVSSAGLSRILLLTDGLANVGTTEPILIADVVERFVGQGISTSTIGIGSEYNEELLGTMAGSGGGATYFLSDPSEATDVFAEELGDLSSVDARDVSVRFIPSVPALTAEQLNAYATDGLQRWRMGDLSGGAPRCLVLEIRTVGFGAPAGTEVLLGHVEVTCECRSDDGYQPFSSLVPVSCRLGTRKDMDAMTPDRDVTLQAAYLMAARSVFTALSFADGGGFDQAAVCLETTANDLAKLRLADELLNARLLDLRKRARQFREEGSDSYDSYARKRMYTESWYVGTCVSEKVQAMTDRAARYGSRSRRSSPAPGTTVESRSGYAGPTSR